MNRPRENSTIGKPTAEAPTRLSIFLSLGFAVLFAATLVGCGGKSAATDSADAEKQSDSEGKVSVHAQAAEVRTIAVTVEGLGRCETLPDRIAVLTPAIEGRVEQILAKRGQTVKKGQAIVQLDSRIAQANLAEKVASRDGFQASLDLLKAPPRAEELKTQESAVEQAKLACEKAKSTVDRLRPLFAKGEIPTGQMNDAEMALKQTELQCDSARAQLQAMKLGPRAEAIAEAEAHVKTANALVDSAQAQLDLLTLKSPIDGVLNNLNCQLGQTIGAGATVGDVVDAYQLQVTVWMPPRSTSQVNRGQTARIAPSGTVKDPNADEGDDDENTVEGSVTFVGQVVDPQTGNLPVQIAIDNSDGKFAVGAIVAAAITVEEVKEVLAIPTAALFDIGEGSVINIIRNGKSVRAEPKLGVQDRQWAEISGTDLKDPLKAGEMVIVEGGYNLPDGTEVAIAAEAADEEPDAKGDKLAKKDAAEPAAEKSTEKAKTSAAGATP